MGALTDSRKRCLIDHHHRLPLLFDLSTGDSPPSKKPKLFSSPTLPPPPVISDRAMQQKNKQPPPPPPPPVLRRFPPPAPLSRTVHGPQRIIRSFGLGSSASRRPRPPFTGFSTEFVRRYVKEKQGSASASAGHGRHESLGLEDYKRMVVDVQEAIPVPCSSVPDEELVLPPVSELPVSELPVVMREGEEASDLYVLDQRVVDDGKVVVESTPVREEQKWVRRSPLYKELYEACSRKRNPVLNELEFEVKLMEKKLSSYRLLREMTAKKPEEDLRGPFAPLTDEEEHAVGNALQGAMRGEILVIHEPSNIEITGEILQCLSYGAWLNDEVINLYLELLKERERREPKRFLKCHFFNTFFFKKLISGKSGYDFKAVKRWTTQRKLGYGLIECDKIFVPVHKKVHWCLAVINVKDMKFQYLDSLGGMDKTVLRTLSKYFMEEVKDKSDKHIDTLAWRHETVGDIPLQKNGWDCGMFMLKYTDFYSRNMGLDFGQEYMKYFRKRTIKEILRLRAE